MKNKKVVSFTAVEFPPNLISISFCIDARKSLLKSGKGIGVNYPSLSPSEPRKGLPASFPGANSTNPQALPRVPRVLF